MPRQTLRRCGVILSLRKSGTRLPVISLAGILDLMNEVTRILCAIEEGDPHAAAQLLPLVYDELRKLAAGHMANEAPGHTLNATALVHEAYLRLVGPVGDRSFANRGHFFAAAAEAMRRILVDSARRKQARETRRWSGPVPGRGRPIACADHGRRFVDRSRRRSRPRSKRIDSSAAELAKLRIFGGLSVEEAAERLGMSRATAFRAWTYARAWLTAALADRSEEFLRLLGRGLRLVGVKPRRLKPCQPIPSSFATCSSPPRRCRRPIGNPISPIIAATMPSCAPRSNACWPPMTPRPRSSKPPRSRRPNPRRRDSRGHAGSGRRNHRLPPESGNQRTARSPRSRTHRREAVARIVPGQVIAGRYTLLEVLGEGGMGTVYRAEQTEPVKRQVALKLIKIGMDSRAVLARFDAERQALALMDHPNIARVYDGGTTEAGQPFFVMELVERRADHRVLRPQAAAGPGPAGAVRRRLPGGAARPPEGDHPPRPEARQRAGHRGRRPADAEGHRLRRRQGDGVQAHRPEPRATPGRSSARRRTCRPSRPTRRRWTSTPGPTSTRWA